MIKPYSFSEWVWILTDECQCPPYDDKQIEDNLKLTLERSVNGLKGIGELLQLAE